MHPSCRDRSCVRRRRNSASYAPTRQTDERAAPNESPPTLLMEFLTGGIREAGNSAAGTSPRGSAWDQGVKMLAGRAVVEIPLAPWITAIPHAVRVCPGQSTAMSR